MATKSELVAKAREFLDTPFRHQGRWPGRGLDCVGVVASAGKALGLGLQDVTNYGRTPDWTRFKGEFEKNGTMLGNTPDLAVPGTLVILRDGRWQTHCGIMAANEAGEPTIIHAYELRSKVVEERFENWKSRLVAVFLLNGVE